MTIMGTARKTAGAAPQRPELLLGGAGLEELHREKPGQSMLQDVRNDETQAKMDAEKCQRTAKHVGLEGRAQRLLASLLAVQKVGMRLLLR